MKNNLMTRKNINVDKANNIPLATFKQEDDVVLKLALFSNSVALDCTGQTLKLGATRRDGTLIELTTGYTINKNEIDIILTNNIISIPGIIECDLEVKDASGKLTTASFFITVNKKVLGENSIAGTNEVDALQKVNGWLEESKELLDYVNQNMTEIEGVKLLKGDKGDKGDPGVQGVQGIQGIRGEKGEPGLGAAQLELTKQDKIDNALSTNAKSIPGAINELSASLETKANITQIGSPLIANTIAEMVDVTKVYVYVGIESGYINGNWYTYNGTSWINGGVYNSNAIAKKGISTYHTDFTKYVYDGNLINPITDLSLGYAFDYETGELYEVENWTAMNNVINISDLDEITVAYINTGNVTNLDKVCYWYCDSLGKALTGTRNMINSVGSKNYKIILDTRYSYIKIATRINRIVTKEEIQIIQSSKYDGMYKDYISPRLMIEKFSFTNAQKEQIIHNPLDNKKIYAFGDSISKGYGSESGKGYTERIAIRNNMRFIDYSVAGASISLNDENKYGSILTQIEKASTDKPDFVILEGGTNDPKYAQVGTISNIGLFDTTGFDKAIFSSALEIAIEKIMTKWVGTTIIFVIAHRSQSHLWDLIPFFNNARDICNKWSIPIVDMWSYGGLNLGLPIHKLTYGASNGTDGTHINDLAYNKFYVPVIEHKLKSLI